MKELRRCKNCERNIYFNCVGVSHVNNGKGQWYHDHNSNGFCNLNISRNNIKYGNIAEPIEEIIEEYETNNNFMEMLKAL